MEGCGYRDLQADFDALGVQIIGVGFDSPEDNQAWAEAEGFAFELWSDTDKTLALAYGAAADASAYFPQRVTVVLDGAGDLALEYAVTDFGTHPSQVLEDVTALFGG